MDRRVGCGADGCRIGAAAGGTVIVETTPQATVSCDAPDNRLPETSFVVSHIELDRQEQLSTHEIPPLIPRLSGVRDLSLNWSNAEIDSPNDDWLAHVSDMAKLEYLRIRKTRGSDTGLSHLARMAQLRQLELSETDVTRAGVEQLLEALPDCDIIWNGTNVKSPELKI